MPTIQSTTTPNHNGGIIETEDLLKVMGYRNGNKDKIIIHKMDDLFGHSKNTNKTNNDKRQDDKAKKSAEDNNNNNSDNRHEEKIMAWDGNNAEEILDPYCNPDDPKTITFQDITSAAFLIKGGVNHTSCERSNLSDQLGMEIYLKKEFMQTTGSFKERGARYALLMLTDEQKKRGVISASSGNHALALSYHAWKLGISATVVMPLAAPMIKIQKCRNYKATVIVTGADMAESKSVAMNICKEEGLIYINGYDHPHIMAGQGTVGLEILEQVPHPDAIIAPIGGGGLVGGLCTAIKSIHPKTKIIGVETAKTASFTNALENGSPKYTPMGNTLADGLAVPKVGYNAFATAKPLLDKMVVVKEEWISLAILRLAEIEKCIVEGAGAASLAAVLAGHLDEFKGKKIVVVLTGGNIDTSVFGRCLERGLAVEGRLFGLTLRVGDHPGKIAELCTLLESLNVTIKNISHERTWLKEINSVEVKVICEARDWTETLQLKQALNDKYSGVIFTDNPLAIQKKKFVCYNCAETPVVYEETPLTDENQSKEQRISIINQ